jgi:DUF4097 and DUF4098 domain-containing protein YvlB
MRSAALALAAALGLAGAAPLAGQTPIAAARATASGGVSIRIHHLEGSVRLIGWDRDSIHVTGRLDAPPTRGGFYFGGSPGGRGFKMGIATTDDGRAVGLARIEVRVPRSSRVWVKANGASIQVEGVEGGLDLYTVGGPVRVTGPVGQLSIESMDGDVEVGGGAGWLRVKTADGRVLLTGSADDAAVSTVSGAIVVEDGRYARGRFESVTGGLEFRGALARGGSYTFETHSGPVTLSLPAAADATVTVTTFGGEVRSDFGAPPASGDSIRLGDGDTSLSVHTFRGAIALRRR